MKIKRIRKNDKQKEFVYTHYVVNGEIKLAKTPEEITGKIIPKPYADVYGFLLSRKEYIEQNNFEGRDAVLRELTIYLAHIKSLIFTNKN